MHLSHILLFVFAAAASLVRVNDKNFKDVVLDSGRFTLVDFYADWCRHCMKLMPTIEELAELYENVPEIQIVKINGDEDGRKMTRKYKVPGFPTLLMFHGDDEPVEFDGMRDLDAISNFVQQVSGIRVQEEKVEVDEEFSSGPSQILELNDENFEQEVLRAGYKTMVAFTAPWCKYCQQLFPVWRKLANSIFRNDNETVRFANVNLSDENKANVAKIVGQFGVASLPTILYFDPQKLDEDGLKRPTPYTEERDLENLLLFVNENAGLSRNADGELTQEAGRIQHLNEAIRTAKKESVSAIANELSALSESVLRNGKDVLVENGELWTKNDISMIPYYGKLVAKIAAGDAQYAEKELGRMERILAKNKRDLEASARDYMQKRVNILKAYLGK
ncbi:hypothetical protein OXX69_007266 [Metschnikowia pulcherrima]